MEWELRSATAATVDRHERCAQVAVFERDELPVCFLHSATSALLQQCEEVSRMVNGHEWTVKGHEWT
jgi:hypothetical protein